MSSNFLEQIVNEPTRNDLNILDLILSNNTDLIHSVSVSKTEKSDHDIVCCTLLHPQFLLNQVATPQFTPSSELDDINFNSADWESINRDLLSADWSTFINPSTHQEVAWDLFESIIVDVCKKHAPSHSHNRQVSVSSKIPKSRRALLRKKKRLNTRINCIKYKSQGPSPPRNSTNSASSMTSGLPLSCL